MHNDSICRLAVITAIGLLSVALLCDNAVVVAAEPVAAWPTLHGDLARSGYYRDFPTDPLRVLWRKELHSELTGPRAEVIVAEGLALMGSYAGKMRAWDARTGEEKWVVQTGGPIGHSPMYAEGMFYFGSMDRKLYAVRARDGSVAWTFDAGEGIWTSPAVFDGQVYFGARDGRFHALDATTGQKRWSVTTGDRILTTASVAAESGRILFGSEDMHVYCVDAASGELLWKSRKLAGLSQRDHFPTIVGGLALVTTNPVRHFHGTLDDDQNMLLRRAGVEPDDRSRDVRYLAGTADDIRREQDFIVAHLREHPGQQTFYALRLEDGSEPWIAPILYTGGLHNPPTPPCFDPETQRVYVLVRSAYGVWDGGGEVRPLTGVGRLRLDTGRVELIEHGHRSGEAGRPAGSKDMPWSAFNTIGDEAQALACTNEMLLSIHQGFIGSMRFSDGITRSLYGKRDTYGGFYGPGNFGWEGQGGAERARAAGQPFGIINEWHGPARSIVSVVGDYVYFHVGSQVICLKGGE